MYRIAEDYNLELQYRRPFVDIWADEKNHPVFSSLSERMGVRDRETGTFLVTDEEMEAVGMLKAELRSLKDEFCANDSIMHFASTKPED
ncbi:MAG: hypothetical protein Q9190_000929 [Brigantiaea leucoxantha]